MIQVFFQNCLVRKHISSILLECQNSLDPDEADVLSGLIWVQTVCKSYQQTTKVEKELLGYRPGE